VIYKEEARDRLNDPLATSPPQEKVPSPVQVIVPEEYKSESMKNSSSTFEKGTLPGIYNICNTYCVCMMHHCMFFMCH